jgi:transposase-like protein
MAEDRMAVLDMLRKATVDGKVDVLREGVRVLAEAIIEAEVFELTGVLRGERASGARTPRSGSTRRSSGGPRSSASSPAGPPSSASSG